MVVGLLGNKSPDSNRFILVTPKPENGVRLQATLGNQNPTGLPVGAVSSLADQYFGKEEVLKNLYVYEDGLIKGFAQTEGTEICKLYVEPFFQSEGIGSSLIEFAIREFHADHLWVLERNTKAIAFYKRHGFRLTGQKKFEEGTTEYIVKLTR